MLPPPPPITADDETIRWAVAGAEVTPLIPAIAALTGDTRILDEASRPDAANMLMPDLGFTEADLERSRRAAVDALVRRRDAGNPQPPPPTDEFVNRLIEWMTGGWDVEPNLEMFREELDVRAEDPRSPRWSAEDIDPDRDFRVAIIGAGMSGLVALHRLRQAGVDAVVYEKNQDVGGTWLENTYPGCRVDVPTFFYSYSFVQRTDWPETYSRQDVLLDYFRTCADDLGLRPHIRFSTEVSSMVWDDDAQHWTLELQGPDGEETVTAHAVISAVGQLNRPKMPDIAGLGSFEGEAFHSARWDHDVELAGKRVGVIGTGCSAAQFIPVVATEASHLTIFQRTPNWLAPAPSIADPIGDGARWLFEHVPTYGHWWRLFQFWRLADGMLPAAEVDPDWTGGPSTVSALNAFVREIFVAHLQESFGDRPDLLEKVVPDYPPIAKRVVRDDGVWAETLKRDDVLLETGPIDEVVPAGIRMADGQLHELDVLIYGTGFRAADFLMPMKVVGRDGVDLHERWGGDARAYLGITVPGFPNLFCLYGPNTNIVINGSIIFFSEAEANYVTQAIRRLLTDGYGSMECRRDVHDEYNERVDAGNRAMAWGVSEVNSWYKNASGRVAQNWPFSLLEYWRQTRDVAPSDYDWRPLTS